MTYTYYEIHMRNKAIKELEEQKKIVAIERSLSNKVLLKAHPCFENYIR